MVKFSIHKSIRWNWYPVVSLNFLNQYTNFETFIRGCINGQVGISGYAFLLAFGILLIVWTNNIINYRQAIV